MSTAAAPATTMSNLDKVEAAALSAWEKYRRQAEPLGLDFGQKMSALRNEISSRGKDGEGFAQWLKNHKIARSTAYYWIESYEISLGRREKPVSNRQNRHNRYLKMHPEFKGSKKELDEAIHDVLRQDFTLESTSSAASTGIEGWSSMAAGERLTRARASGCEYCNIADSTRSCPTHGHLEKRSPESRITPESAPAPATAVAVNVAAPKKWESDIEHLIYRINGVREAIEQVIAKKKWWTDPYFNTMKLAAQDLAKRIEQLDSLKVEPAKTQTTKATKTKGRKCVTDGCENPPYRFEFEKRRQRKLHPPVHNGLCGVEAFGQGDVTCKRCLAIAKRQEKDPDFFPAWMKKLSEPTVEQGGAR
jgi:hypothetical protein